MRICYYVYELIRTLFCRRSPMKLSETILEQSAVGFPISRFASPEQILFLDIETTGFTARSSYLYLIGCAYYQNGKWAIIQWMAENYEEEGAVLKAFFEFAASYSFLFHFNGNNFDLPYLTQKCEQLSLPYNFDRFDGVDIFRRVSPYKFFLKLPNCRQKTIEQFLGICREDRYTGGELIDLYHAYVKEPSKEISDLLFLHNSDDIKGMLEILPILTYDDLFTQPLKIRKVQANYYRDEEGNTRKELLIHASVEPPIPVPISAHANGCFVRGEGNAIVIKVPIFETELKYFYSNYHDYYYLPNEDIALHKSVAGFVEKPYRIPASASNCYTRKYSNYLPQWGMVFQPFFKRDYKSKELFFELTDELKKDREAFSTYAGHILAMIASTY